MFKKILIFGLVAVVAIAVAVSAYNVVAGSATGDEPEVVSSAPASVPPVGVTAPGNSPQDGVTPQGSGRQAGSADQGSGWQSDATTQNGGQGNRYGQGGRGQGQGGSQGAGTQTGVPNPQAAQNESVTLHGVVSNYAAPNFTLITDDGQSVAVQLGNQSFVSNLGINLQEGDAVTLVGFYETSDSFAVSSMSLDASGQTYVLRDQASGRPMWAGGPKNH